MKIAMILLAAMAVGCADSKPDSAEPVQAPARTRAPAKLVAECQAKGGVMTKATDWECKPKFPADRYDDAHSEAAGLVTP